MSRSIFALALVGLLALVALPSAANEDDEWTPLDRYFRGRIAALDKEKVTIRYDFSTKDQLEDWFEAIPFPVKRLEDQGVEWAEQSLTIRGNTGVRHAAEWSGDIRVSCRFVLVGEKDVGGMLTPGNESKDFATFTLAEHFFHRWDRQKGGQHSIIKFGEKFRKRGFGSEFTGFRYVARRPVPKPLIAGRTVPVAFGLKRGKLFFDAQGLELKGKDIGVKLKKFQPGFYAVGKGVRVDHVEISGELDDTWRKACAVALIVEKPIEKDDK